MARQQRQSNGGAVAKPKKANKTTLRDLLESPDTKAAMERVLPKYLTVDRMIGLAMLAVTQQKKLLECRPQSIVQSVMQAAQLGLEVGGPLGHAYLVPYKSREFGLLCQLIPGYRGVIYLAKNSGAIVAGEARLEVEAARAAQRAKDAAEGREIVPVEEAEKEGDGAEENGPADAKADGAPADAETTGPTSIPATTATDENQDGYVSIDDLEKALEQNPALLDGAIKAEFRREVVRVGALRVMLSFEHRREGGPRKDVVEGLEQAIGQQPSE